MSNYPLWFKQKVQTLGPFHRAEAQEVIKVEKILFLILSVPVWPPQMALLWEN